MCMYGPPGVGHLPLQPSALPRSDCSGDTTRTGPPLAAWLATPPPSPSRDEPERELVVAGAA